ncbi:50S ribosomal protein L9 [candidate division WOR-1 bacterium RIFOXYB2_FULL_48_7]|uniref:Large ribosomal subunit protein bL9 n=1 Tax=candidate division WOR-1 bacterium RIFOXYB2_FULL_48_7 TaxID=1802583 RepID=A0A1F4TQU5_UNCSA|nr:MAG: 50S ribosomal protein L9 [candidate division WOR-1 bacterium RIFOXYB2_FULL_48_7]
MKVIFLEDERVEKVSEGYARNYLLPNGLAVVATPKAVAAAEKRLSKRRAEIDRKRSEMLAFAEKLGQVELTIPVDAGEGGKLFGSITSTQIADTIKQTEGIDIDKRKIDTRQSIKMLGEYTVKVRLFQDISADVKVKVVQR